MIPLPAVHYALPVLDDERDEVIGWHVWLYGAPTTQSIWVPGNWWAEG